MAYALQWFAPVRDDQAAIVWHHFPRVLLEATIETDYGQFDLGWDDGFEGFAGDFEEVFTGQVNGACRCSASGRPTPQLGASIWWLAGAH